MMPEAKTSSMVSRAADEPAKPSGFPGRCLPVSKTMRATLDV